MTSGYLEKGGRCARWQLSALFPLLQGPDRNTKEFGERRLREAGRRPGKGNPGSIGGNDFVFFNGPVASRNDPAHSAVGLWDKLCLSCPLMAFHLIQRLQEFRV